MSVLLTVLSPAENHPGDEQDASPLILLEERLKERMEVLGIMKVLFLCVVRVSPSPEQLDNLLSLLYHSASLHKKVIFLLWRGEGSTDRQG